MEALTISLFFVTVFVVSGAVGLTFAFLNEFMGVVALILGTAHTLFKTIRDGSFQADKKLNTLILICVVAGYLSGWAVVHFSGWIGF